MSGQQVATQPERKWRMLDIGIAPAVAAAAVVAADVVAAVDCTVAVVVVVVGGVVCVDPG